MVTGEEANYEAGNIYRQGWPTGLLVIVLAYFEKFAVDHCASCLTQLFHFCCLSGSVV